MGSLGPVELRYLDLVLDAMVGHLTGQIGNQGESQRPIMRALLLGKNTLHFLTSILPRTLSQPR